MLLVLGDDHVGAEHVRALEREFQVVVAPTTASDREHFVPAQYEAVVVDVSSVRILRRAGEGRVPTVAVVDEAVPEFGVDETVRAPVDPDELVTAVRRAVRLEAYEDAVDDLFEACRRGRRRPTGRLRDLRERADRRLQALQPFDDGLPFERLVDT